MGGLLGESKHKILKKLPQHLVPPYMLLSHLSTVNDVLCAMKKNGFQFPVIFKPDLGEGGWMVEKISSEKDIANYLTRIKLPFIMQKYVDDPLEFGMFYRRFPSEERGSVISVTWKKFLSVTGDGRHTLQELIMMDDRAKLHWKKLKMIYARSLDDILPAGESYWQKWGTTCKALLL